MEMDMSEIMETLRRGEELVRQIDRKWTIVAGALTVAAVLLAGLLAVLAIDAWREKKRLLRAQAARLEEERARLERDAAGHWGHYRPTVTGDVEILNGVEFRRMGAAGSRQ